LKEKKEAAPTLPFLLEKKGIERGGNTRLKFKPGREGKTKIA